MKIYLLQFQGLAIVQDGSLSQCHDYWDTYIEWTHCYCFK